MGEQESDFNPQKYTKQAKIKALRYLDEGQLKQAIDSMVSSLSEDPNRPEEQKQIIAMMGLDLRNKRDLNERDVRDFINGFAE